ncbi:unnamed protein product [Ambrosiozyma monospora]|uniref:Unnamed protein product n=1 Tax=Ambrosiozyma monospora TaxID=43982 RepID=A0A9W7DG01_AMBMO|nr:unnamed protein product [Ambrosiozyma monospora]
MFLLVIHLGSITLYDCAENPVPEVDADPDVRFLIENPINSNMVMLARLATRPFMSHFGTCYKMFQVYLFLKIADQYSPGQAEQLESQGSYSLIFQTMVKLGLNRDPSRYNDLKGKSKVLNLVRKTWHGVRCDDYFPGFTGDDFFCKLVSSNTQLPCFLGETASGVADLEIEKVTISCLLERTKFHDLYRDLANVAMDLRNNPYVKDLLEFSTKLEDLVKQELGDIDELLTLTTPQETFPQRIKKATKFVEYIEAMATLVCLYCHFFLFYETKCKPALAFKYFKQSIKISTKVYMVVSRILTNQKLYFGSGLDYYITPNILYIIERFHFIFVITLLRYKHFFYMTYISGNMTPELEQLIDNSFKCAGRFFKMSGKMFVQINHYYYNAWRYNKLEAWRYQLLAKTVKGLFDVHQPVGESMPQTSSNVFFKWSHEMLQEICDVMLTAENDKGPTQNSTLNPTSTSVSTTAPVSISVPVPTQNTTSAPTLSASATTTTNNIATASTFQERPLQKTSSLNIYSDFHSIRDDYDSLSPKNTTLDNNWFNKLVDSRMNSFMVTNQDLNFWKKPRGVGSTSEIKVVDGNERGNVNVNGYGGNHGVSTAANVGTSNVIGSTMNGTNNSGFSSGSLGDVNDSNKMNTNFADNGGVPIDGAKGFSFPQMDDGFCLTPSENQEAMWDDDSKFNELFHDLNDSLKSTLINELQIQ